MAGCRKEREMLKALICPLLDAFHTSYEIFT
jgi:hypothetical protein